MIHWLADTGSRDWNNIVRSSPNKTAGQYLYKRDFANNDMKKRKEIWSQQLKNKNEWQKCRKSYSSSGRNRFDDYVVMVIMVCSFVSK